MSRPKRPAPAAARLRAAEKVLDDLFREIRQNTARTKEIRERCVRKQRADEPAEQSTAVGPAKEPDEKK